MPTEVFMVFCPTNRCPKIVHNNIGDAKDEAERIAIKEKEVTYILKAVMSCCPDPPVQPSVKWENL